MPASWRPSRSTPGDGIAEHAIDEIVALAGVDRMTIPPPLLELLAGTDAPLPRKLEPEAANPIEAARGTITRLARTGAAEVNETWSNQIHHQTGASEGYQRRSRPPRSRSRGHGSPSCTSS